MKGLTEKQKSILSYIEEYIEKNSYSPSYREIQDHFSLKSLSTIHKYINTLIRKGHLKAEKAASRSLALEKQATKGLSIPIVGHFSLERGIELHGIEDKALEMAPSLVPNPDQSYFLIATGRALEAHLIQEGDLLLVEARTHIEPGETAICKGPHLTSEPLPGMEIQAVLILSLRNATQHLRVQAQNRPMS